MSDMETVPQTANTTLNQTKAHVLLPHEQETVSEHRHHMKNVYPTIRLIILTALVLLFVFIILLLILQNGRSIYEHGL